MDQPTEFICIDCGYHVFVYNYVQGQQTQRCATCDWLNDITNEETRENVRKWLDELNKRDNNG
jgi:DNA-directed RNA polymerase subunit RPC12/RpoP